MLQEYKINVNPNTVKYIWDEPVDRNTFVQNSYADKDESLKILQDLVKASDLEKAPVEVLESIMDLGLKEENFRTLEE